MKKKPILIIVFIFLLGLFFSMAYYFFYLEKIAIYDLADINIPGISSDETSAIKINGITPLDKKISIYKKDGVYNTSGSYKSIEISIPDTLISKIVSVHISLKKKTFTFKIKNLHLTGSSGNTHTYLLPPELKSDGPFLNKLFAAYPFSSRWVDGLLIMLGSIICIWLLIKGMRAIPEKHKLKKLLHTRIFHYLLMVFFFIILLLWIILWPKHIKITYFLTVLIYISFLLQIILRMKMNYALYLFRLIMIILLCFEFFFGIVNLANSDELIFSGTKNYQVSDSIVGFKFKQNCKKVKVFKTFNRDTVYNVTYSSDEYSRRLSDTSLSNDSLRDKSKKTKHAIFLGCSVTFGQGLNYSSTFPAIFEYKNPGYTSYNYGFPGYGPHQTSLLFDGGINTINNEAVPEDSGVCIYSYFDCHLERVFGGSKYLSWSGDTPDVYVNNHKLVCKKRSRIQKYIAWLHNNSETLQYFNITTLYPKTIDFYQRFADIINYSAEKYWKLKPHGTFYVIFYPISNYNQDTSWLMFLDKKIKVFRIADPLDYNTNPSYCIKNDGHPTKKLNAYYVDQLSKMIGKDK